MKRVYILMVILGVGIACAFLGYFRENVVLQGIGLVALLAGFVGDRAWLRCPHCRKHYKGQYQPGKPCPHCGHIME